MEPEEDTNPNRIGSTSRSASLVELIHPFRKDSRTIPLKSGASKSTLSLRGSKDAL